MLTATLLILGISVTILALWILGALPHKRGAHSINFRVLLTGSGSEPSRRVTAASPRRFQVVNGGEPPAAIEVSGLTKAEAEEWLDWLENRGYRHCELTFVDPAGFSVRHKLTAA
jgi:hypothetical protein